MSKFRITPIGTCRIHTPLKRATARYPIEIDVRRNYGFVHSSQEALQLIQFLQGEKSFPPQVAPIVARDESFAAYDGTSWNRADLHIVEISSSKLISSHGFPVQANYIGRHFADFFASPERTRAYWTFVRTGNRRDLLEFVRDDPSYRRMSPEDRELILSITQEQQSYRSLQADMNEILERLGPDRVIFVTHVNALTVEDKVIPARDRLIRIVQSASEELQTPVFDPTELMRSFGQERALENGGLDLTHYTPSFSDAVFDEIYQLHVAGRMADVGGDISFAETEPGAAVAAKLARALDIDDFKSVARKVFAAIRETPDSKSLISLRGLIRSRIGDFESALVDLRVGGDEAGLPEEMRIALLDAMCQTGDPEGALRVASSLLSDEYESPAIFSMAAKAAEQLGRSEEALSYAKQAFRRDHSNLAAALRALKVASEHGDPAEVTEWRSEILDNLADAKNGGVEVCLWAISNCDVEMFGAAIGSVAKSDKAGTIDLLEKAAEAGMPVAVADAVLLMARLGRIEPALSHRRADLIQWVLNEAARMVEADRLLQAHRLAQSLLQLEGASNSQLRTDKLIALARRYARIAERHVRTSIREAFGKGDQKEVIRLGDEARLVLPNDADTAIIVARALHGADRQAEAIELLSGAQAANPDHLGAHRWLGRFANLAGDYKIAIRNYGPIARSSDPAAETFRAEAERFFERVGRRALRQARDLWREDRFQEAIEVVEAMRDEKVLPEETELELGRMHRLLRVRLREVEQEENDLAERETILRLMDRIKPDDEAVLRRLALEFMRQFRFGEAADYWERLDAIKPNNETVLRNRQKCRILAARKAKSALTEVAA